MRIKFKDMSLFYKILGIGLIIILIFVVTTIAYVVPTMREAVINAKKEKLNDVVTIAMGYLASIYDDYQSGKVKEDEAKIRALRRIENMRYGPEGKDYLWVNDYHPKMIMHPYTKHLEGKDLTDYKDPFGKRIFVEMVNVCKGPQQSGYVEYMWQWKDHKDVIVPKISYVKAFKQWDWIIGTGIYLKDVQDEVNAILMRIGIIIFLICIVTIVLIYFFSRSIKNNVARCVLFSKNIINGDLTSRIDLDQKDEVGVMAFNFNNAIDAVEQLVSNIIIASQNLSQAVAEIASGNQNLSQRTSEQASSLEEIASTIEEATANVKQNAENATEANKLAGYSTQLAEEGGKVTAEAVASINEINQASKKIGEITAVINEISFQTNLLALNAAVEAARAGEQGRGFAVVASEIRNLAQRSGNAAKEIADMIKDTVEKVSNGTTLVNNSGESLKEIIKGVRDLNRFIAEITAASDEQMRGMDQINVAIAEMDTMTQQNAALVEETASASEEMSNQAQELLSMTEKFIINENLKGETVQKKHKELHLHAKEKAAPMKKAAKIEYKGGTKDGGPKDSNIKKALEDEGFEEF